MTYICITPYFPSANSVIGPFVYDQVRAIERSGRFDRVIVLKPCSWYQGKLEYVYDGITVHLFRSFQLPSKVLPDVFNVLNTFFFCRRLKQLGITRDDAFVAHLHTSPLAKYGAWMKQKFARCCVWLQHHDLDPLLIRMGRLRNVRWHQRLVVRKRVAYLASVDLQVCVSEAGLRQLQAFPQSVLTTFPHYLEMLENMRGLPPVSIREAYVLRNGADRRKFFPELVEACAKPPPKAATTERGPPKNTKNGLLCTGGTRSVASARGFASASVESNIDLRSAPSFACRPFRIGCVAAFNEWKGQLTLVQAAEAVLERMKEGAAGEKRAIDVTFIGQGPFLKACQTYVREHHLEPWIHFEQTRGHRDLLRFYQSLDLFVLPSFFETFACVYLEVYSCGVPFMCCKGQGNAESIPAEDADRWTVDPGDAQGLAERIEAFMEQRYPQTLTHAHDIDVLVGEFLRAKEAKLSTN